MFSCALMSNICFLLCSCNISQCLLQKHVQSTLHCHLPAIMCNWRLQNPDNSFDWLVFQPLRNEADSVCVFAMESPQAVSHSRGSQHLREQLEQSGCSNNQCLELSHHGIGPSLDTKLTFCLGIHLIGLFPNL